MRSSLKMKIIQLNNEAYLEMYCIDSSVKRACAVIVPGGGYLKTSDNEAGPVAIKFNQNGINAVCLRYTTNNCIYPKPIKELDMTLCYIEKNSEELNIDCQQIFLIGFSAGGNLIANYLSYNASDFYRKSKIVIKAQVLCYALLDFSNVICDNPEKQKLIELCTRAVMGNETDIERISPTFHVHAQLPPTFLWHTALDSLVACSNSVNYAERLHAFSIPYELHIFSQGEHGLSLADKTTARHDNQVIKSVACWFDLMIDFISINGICKKG